MVLDYGITIGNFVFDNAVGSTFNIAMEDAMAMADVEARKEKRELDPRKIQDVQLHLQIHYLQYGYGRTMTDETYHLPLPPHILKFLTQQAGSRKGERERGTS